MASIVGHILTFLEEEEDAFWALVCLMDDERYQMKELFLPGRPKIFPYFDHHLVLRKQFLPSVHKHLEKHNFEPNLYAFKWFALCYLESLPTSLVLRVWDVFLLEGEEILSAMAIALLKTCKKNILNSVDFEQLHDFFSKLNEIQVSSMARGCFLIPIMIEIASTYIKYKSLDSCKIDKFAFQHQIIYLFSYINWNYS